MPKRSSSVSRARGSMEQRCDLAVLAVLLISGVTLMRRYSVQGGRSFGAKLLQAMSYTRHRFFLPHFCVGLVLVFDNVTLWC